MAWLNYLVDYGIIGLLILLSVISLAIFVERWVFLRKIHSGGYEGSRRTLEIAITRK
jgi:biopolymer transport protein ExbB